MNPETCPHAQTSSSIRWLTLSAASLWMFACWAAEETPGSASFSIRKEPQAVVVRGSNGKVILQYQLQRLADSKLSVESACYIHPVATPRGVILTDVAPSDHLHHRGIFLAWVEMHGKKDADFWGWGEHAPTSGRRIVNQKISGVRASTGQATFTASNDWLAEDVCLLKEDLHVSVHAAAGAHVIDLAYRLDPQSDLTLSQWAFSGFCVRTRKDGSIEAESPTGPVKFANPKHTEPASDWPAAAWYDYTLRLPDGTVAGIAVINHPQNPPSLWHNHRDVRMLNPSIIAPGKISLNVNQPLNLRYRVVAHDGPVSKDLLDRLATEWAGL